MKITRKELRQVIRESIQRLGEAEVIDLAQQKGLPWEFGPEGYASRGHGLETKMAHLGRDPQRRDEEIIAVALSNRAEELIGYKRSVDPDYFHDLADDLVHDIRVGQADDVAEIVSRIDADYFDEEIMDVQEWQMEKFKGLAAQQSPDDIDAMEREIEAKLAGKLAGKVVDIDIEDDDDDDD